MHYPSPLFIDFVFGNYLVQISACYRTNFEFCGAVYIIKLRRMRWTRHVARMEKKRNAARILVAKPEEKRPLERPRHMWVDNIKMDFTEIEWDGMDWIDTAIG
jgi:predicted membrane protein